MKITIVLQFENAKDEYKIWADEERSIDFYSEKKRAARCTVAFAALELFEHLERCLESAVIAVDEKPIPTRLTCALWRGIPKSAARSIHLSPRGMV